MSEKPMSEKPLTELEGARNALADLANGWGSMDAAEAKAIRDYVETLEARLSAQSTAAAEMRERAAAYCRAQAEEWSREVPGQRVAYAAIRGIARAIAALPLTPPTAEGERPICTCGRLHEGTRLTQNHERGCPMAQQPAVPSGGDEVTGHYLCECGTESAAVSRDGVRVSKCDGCGRPHDPLQLGKGGGPSQAVGKWP